MTRTPHRVPPRVLAEAVAQRFGHAEHHHLHTVLESLWPADSPYTPTLLGAAQVIERSSARPGDNSQTVTVHQALTLAAADPHVHGIYDAISTLVADLRAEPLHASPSGLLDLALAVVESHPDLWALPPHGHVAWTAATDEVLAALQFWDGRGLLAACPDPDILNREIAADRPSAPARPLHPAERRALYTPHRNPAVTRWAPIAVGAGCVLTMTYSAIARHWPTGVVAVALTLLTLAVVLKVAWAPVRLYGDHPSSPGTSNATIAATVAEHLAGQYDPESSVVTRTAAVQRIAEQLDQRWLEYSQDADTMLETMPRLRDDHWPATRAYLDAISALQTAIDDLGMTPEDTELQSAENAAEAAQNAWTAALVSARDAGATTLPSSERKALREARRHLDALASSDMDPGTRATHLRDLRSELKKLRTVPVSHEQLLALPQMESIRDLALDRGATASSSNTMKGPSQRS